jgi:hypothetical protein
MEFTEPSSSKARPRVARADQSPTCDRAHLRLSIRFSGLLVTSHVQPERGSSLSIISFELSNHRPSSLQKKRWAERLILFRREIARRCLRYWVLRLHWDGWLSGYRAQTTIAHSEQCIALRVQLVMVKSAVQFQSLWRGPRL